ncbi:MAG: hypothetical protein AW08_01817 [Candidatus Accumulibacter adjunctus]|uniref:Uncharacterized protein n=1 Tax=Candidatus Accumulibacter adjunctus TaxID=1454001 RepID=A0A011MYB7_9PROT|nr:MAG: hypothetical protein AW08_01817 [Candidatus Accumulibacter adjunctus]
MAGGQLNDRGWALTIHGVILQGDEHEKHDHRARTIEQGAVLLHKDPEFKVVPVRQELLPLREQ